MSIFLDLVTGKRKISDVVREKIVAIHKGIEAETGEEVMVVIGKFAGEDGVKREGIGIMKADWSGWVYVNDGGEMTCYLSDKKIAEYLK